MNDDPREVLALLNSLGFVGITAQQLKGFMKDLKIYRKVKELERQQRKEEIAKKIIDKQQSDMKRILREQGKHLSSVINSVSTNSSNSIDDNSIVKIKVHCVSNDKENREHVNSEDSHLVIRPWRLQPEAQKGSNAKKSDPVALYQKYQQEWKQMSFPGEAKHAGLRWAIREKMLGGDPHPVPLPRKSTSMPILKKK
ncbi:uncharacterized protein LOC144470182 isoform X2 [Augochlora pura]